MNPFGQIISLSLFVRLLIIALGRRCMPFVRLLSPAKVGERTVLWISIAIMFAVGWVSCLFAFSILVMGFVDDHSNVHLLVDAAHTVSTWVESGLIGWNEVVITLMPLPVAAVATFLQLHSLIQKRYMIQQKA